MALSADEDRCTDRGPVVELLHGGIIQGDATARPVSQFVIRLRAIVAVNVDLAAEPGVLRRHSMQADRRENLGVFHGSDQAGGAAALCILGVGVADAQGPKILAPGVLGANIELADGRGFIAFDGFVGGPIPAERHRIRTFETIFNI